MDARSSGSRRAHPRRVPSRARGTSSGTRSRPRIASNRCRCRESARRGRRSPGRRGASRRDQVSWPDRRARAVRFRCSRLRARRAVRNEVTKVASFGREQGPCRSERARHRPARQDRHVWHVWVLRSVDKRSTEREGSGDRDPTRFLQRRGRTSSGWIARRHHRGACRRGHRACCSAADHGQKGAVVMPLADPSMHDARSDAKGQHK